VDPEARRAGQAATRAFFAATRALCQCRGSGASGEYRGHRRNRSQPQPHQLGITAGLPKSSAGDSVVLQLPGGAEYLSAPEVFYERISVEPFREPPGSEASAKGLPRRR